MGEPRQPYDPALPAMPLLLDADALGALLGGPVCRRYVRWKPGTSCVLAATVERCAGPEDVLVTAVAAAALPKLRKSAHAAPDGSVLLADPRRGLLVTTPAADRDLPALRALARGRAPLVPPGARLRRLAYKPHRRWVGLAESAGDPVVLRAYRRRDLVRSVRAADQLAGGVPRTPALLGADPALGLAVLEWLPGTPLDVALSAAAAGGAGADAVRRTGAALAALHARGPLTGAGGGGGPSGVGGAHHARGHGADHARGHGLGAAARQVGRLAPDLAADGLALARELAAGLAALPVPAPALVHGDFSADQVVLDADGGVGLLDLDAAGTGDAAADLAGFAAAALAACPDDPARVALLAGELLEGYATVARPPDPRRVELHVRVHLLRRAAEPFRTCRPDWPERLRHLLHAAATPLEAVA